MAKLICQYHKLGNTEKRVKISDNALTEWQVLCRDCPCIFPSRFTVIWSLRLMSEIQQIKSELVAIKDLFARVIQIIPAFNLTDPAVLPYGLKPHTRSVSWIVEQVIVQQAKYHATNLGLDAVDIDLPDTCLHDCVIHMDGKPFYVNVKITNARGKRNKNDISAVEKLYMQYKTNTTYRLIYAVFGFTFQNTKVSFVQGYTHTFSPQFLPIYVNPRNDKLQAYYEADPEYRTRSKFLRLLQANSTSITLT